MTDGILLIHVGGLDTLINLKNLLKMLIISIF